MKLPCIKDEVLRAWAEAPYGRARWSYLFDAYLQCRRLRRNIDKRTSSSYNDRNCAMNLTRMLKKHGVKLGPPGSCGPWWLSNVPDHVTID